jgi:endonuclease/exonuclease/phosphatase (EEP) superfamily protein YafD
VPPRKGGHPSTVRDLQAFVNYTYQGIQQVKAKMRQFGKIGPVFTCLDSNIDAFADMRVRHDRFPYVQWKQADTFSNWDLIRRRPPYASAFGRHIDQVWLTRGKHHQTRFEDHWVLTGFHSDHKPVMVKAKMKGKA